MTWVGTCTFGPVDVYLAQLSRTLGDEVAARRWLASATAVLERLGAPAMLARVERLRVGR